MERYYLFKASKPLDKTYFSRALEGYPHEIEWKGSMSGSVFSDDDFAIHLDDILNNIREDLGVALCVLSCHTDGELEYAMLEKAFELYPAGNLFLSSFLLDEISRGDLSFLPLLKEEFSGVSYQNILTAEAFLRSGLNASLAANSLYLHRNTFNYRLAHFIDESHLDIREYHNASLFEIYLAYRNK